MTEEFAVDIWYRNEKQLAIEAEDAEEAIDKAEERFRAIKSGQIDTITVTGTVEDGREAPLDGGAVRRSK